MILHYLIGEEMMNCYPEPTLDEVLSDEVTQAVMNADAIDPAELRAMLRRMGAVLPQPPHDQN